MTVGEKIKARRLELGLSQRGLATKLGYSDHTTVARIESGKVDLNQARIAQFAEALGVKPSQLMVWHDDPEDAGAVAAAVVKDEDLLQLVQNYLILDAVDRATVQALVASLAKKKKD
jgi:transcriptional regulator with XRE-family HTH domain